MAAKRSRTRKPEGSGESVEEALERARRDRQVLESDVERMRRHAAELADRLLETRKRLEWMERTRSWTLTQPLRAATELARNLRGLIRQAPSHAQALLGEVRKRGAAAALTQAAAALRAPPREQPADRAAKAELDAILVRHAGKPIIVAPPLVDWNVPLFQRPQQLALSLAQAGSLYFFCTRNSVFDHYRGFTELVPGCFVTDREDLLQSIPGKVMHVSSTARGLELEQIRAWQARGDRIWYDYIDELHPDISGAPIPRAVTMRHYALLCDESVACIATADKLWRDVRQLRQKNFALVTNGVDAPHFARARQGLPVPQELERLSSGGRPVVGYYGALASWFDYGLIRGLARARPELEILLIGEDYDGSLRLAGLEQHQNITVLGPVPYALLPRYAQVFDVSIIPFVANEITHATSPLKLFEYMALGAPIVTTDLAECRKYASCLIARDAAEFVRQIDAGLLRADDPEYRRTLQAEAEANTWAAKARQIRALLDSTQGASPP